MPVYRTTFAVDAPAARVWEALTALDRYPEWNLQIPRIRGSLRPGERIDLQLALPGRPPMNRRVETHGFDSAKWLMANVFWAKVLIRRRFHPFTLSTPVHSVRRTSTGLLETVWRRTPPPDDRLPRADPQADRRVIAS